MNLFSVKNIRSLLKKYGTSPLKRFGQNFLVDERVVKKIIEAGGLGREDVVLEIGPGIGTVTQELAKKVRKVIAVEKDRNMIEVLSEALRGCESVEIVRGDILRLELRPSPKYKVVANLPFYITSPVIRRFLETMEVKPKQMVLVVQKEVGQRICARPPRMSILAVSVQVYAEAEIVSYVSKKSFWPQPEVDAAIISVRPSPGLGRLRPDLRQTFFKVVKAGFSQPRKQILNNFSKGLRLDRVKIEEWLKENGIKPQQRAETLSVSDWINLTKSLKMD